jgi:hypothetical protein
MDSLASEQYFAGCVGSLLHPRVLQRRNQVFLLMDPGFLSDSLLVDAGAGQNQAITDSFS